MDLQENQKHMFFVYRDDKSLKQNKDMLIRQDNHRYIFDYLVEEVLQRQPEPIREFLLQTAILDRLNES